MITELSQRYDLRLAAAYVLGTLGVEDPPSRDTAELERIVRDTINRSGRVIIPTFAVGRSRGPLPGGARRRHG